MSQLAETISSEDARCFYDRLGAWHDFGQSFERKAKDSGLDRLDLLPGQRVLNVGVGTGKEQAAIQEQILPGGVAVGIDLSRTMLNISRQRVPSPGGQSLCEADARRLPFPDHSFDRVFSSYVLDLIPAADLRSILSQIRRTLKVDGRFVNVSLTEGVSLGSRALVGAWKAFYRLSPFWLGGCRPVRLTYPLLQAGFDDIERQVIVQMGMPSEVIVARPCKESDDAKLSS